MILVTHEPTSPRGAQRRITFRDGAIVEDARSEPRSPPSSAALAALAPTAAQLPHDARASIIGVAAVIAMVAVGERRARRIEEQIKCARHQPLGHPARLLHVGRRRAGARLALALTEDDLAAINASASRRSPRSPASSAAAQLIVVGNTNWTTSIDGVSADFLTCATGTLAEGRTFTEAEPRSARQGRDPRPDRGAASCSATRRSSASRCAS